MIIYETAREPFECRCGRQVHKGDRKGTIEGVGDVCQRCADKSFRDKVDQVLMGEGASE